MADSEFWRKLSAEFFASPDFRADGHYIIGSGRPWTWQLAGVGADYIRASFEALACRAASEIESSGITDLVTVWLERLRLGSYSFQFTGEAEEVPTGGTKGIHYQMGSIHGVCRASATLCKKLEADATQAEFEEKQRNNPKNWTQFRQRIEAFESMKEVRNAPPYRIPEAVVRNIIAEIDGIKPEEVTWKRIAFEIAGLGGPNRRHIEVVPTSPPESPPSPKGAESERSPSKQPHVEKPESVNVPAESVAAQIERLRDECRWTNEQLAEVAGLSTRQVARHVSGEATPYKRNIAAYERVFSKKLKKQVVISNKS